MTLYVRAVVVTALVFGSISCGPSRAEQVLGGTHVLRKMTLHDGANASMSGSFFLLSGGLKGAANGGVRVSFAWPLKDGTYAISTLPIEKFRVKLDESVTAPTITFRWAPCYERLAVQEIMDRSVIYAVLTVKESDWPVQVELPLNSQ